MKFFDWLFKILKPYLIRPNGLKDGELCPDCGTTDCRSYEWYVRQLRISDNRSFSVDTKAARKFCNFRQNLKKMDEFFNK